MASTDNQPSTKIARRTRQSCGTELDKIRRESLLFTRPRPTALSTSQHKTGCFRLSSTVVLPSESLRTVTHSMERHIPTHIISARLCHCYHGSRCPCRNENNSLLAATLRWFTAGARGAIRIAVRQLSQTWKLRH